MKSRILLLSLSFILISFSLFAQKGFKSGYIITNQKDTVYGKIESNEFKIMNKICRFKDNESAIIKEFLPGEIYGYRFIDSRFYVSKEINDQKLFLEYLISGNLDAYCFTDDDYNEHYYIQEKGMPLSKIKRYEEINQKKDGTKYLYTRTLSKEGLIDLVKEYNKSVGEDDSFVLFNPYKPELKFAAEISAGFTNYFNTDDPDVYLPNEFKFRTGIFVYFWLPQEEPDAVLYFKTGLILNSFGANKSSENMPSYRKYDKIIPLLLEIRFLQKSAVTPKLAAGANYYFSKSFGIQIETGVNINLGSNFLATVYGGVDFHGYFAMTGLHYKF